MTLTVTGTKNIIDPESNLARIHSFAFPLINSLACLPPSGHQEAWKCLKKWPPFRQKPGLCTVPHVCCIMCYYSYLYSCHSGCERAFTPFICLLWNYNCHIVPQQWVIVSLRSRLTTNGWPMDRATRCLTVYLKWRSSCCEFWCGSRRDPFPPILGQLAPNWVRAEHWTGTAHRRHIHRAVNERGLKNAIYSL